MPSVVDNPLGGSDEELPAWSLPREAVHAVALPSAWPRELSREWAWGGSSGDGARVAVVGSGVDGDHPRVGGALARAVAVVPGPDGRPAVVDDDRGDLWSRHMSEDLRGGGPRCDGGRPRPRASAGVDRRRGARHLRRSSRVDHAPRRHARRARVRGGRRRVAAALEGLEGPRRVAAARLLGALEELVADDRGPGL